MAVVCTLHHEEHHGDLIFLYTHTQEDDIHFLHSNQEVLQCVGASVAMQSKSPLRIVLLLGKIAIPH